MTTDCPAPAPAPDPAPPSPLELSKRLARPPVDGPVRQLECLGCDAVTGHTLGPATYDDEGNLLVQWWECLVCREGHTVC